MKLIFSLSTFFTLVIILSCSEPHLSPEISPEEPLVQIESQSNPTFDFTNTMIHQDLDFTAITNDGYLLANDKDTIKVWDYKKNSLIRKIVPATPDPISVALSKNESWLYIFHQSNSNQFIQVLDWRKGVVVKTISIPDGARKYNNGKLKVSADDKFLIYFSSGLCIWDLANSRLLTRIDTENNIRDVSISNDARYIAVAENYTVKIWDIKEGSVSTINISINNVAFNPENSELICGGVNQNNPYQSTLSFYNLKKGTLLHKIASRSIYGILLADDGKSCFTGDHLINLKTREVLWENVIPNAKGTSISKNWRNAAYYFDNGSIEIYENFQKIHTTSEDRLNGLAKTGASTGEMLFVGNDREMKGFSLTGGATISYQNEAAASYLDEIETVGNLFIAQTCSKLILWDVLSGRLDKTIEIPEIESSYCQQHLSSSSQTSLVAVKNRGSRNVHVYEPKSGNLVRTLTGFGNELNYSKAIISDDGKYILGYNEDKNSIKALSVTYGSVEKLFPFDSRKFEGSDYSNFALNADNSLLAFGTRTEIVLFDFVSGEIRHRIKLPGTDFSPQFLEFSPDGKRMIYGNFKTLVFAEVLEGKIVRQVHSKFRILNAGFNKSGTLVHAVTQKQLISFEWN